MLDSHPESDVSAWVRIDSNILLTSTKNAGSQTSSVGLAISATSVHFS